MHIEIRSAKADDIDAILLLLLPYSEEGIILRRSRSEILHALDKFFIAGHGKEIIGVISYYDYGKRLKEVRSLAVNKSWSGKGAGSKLLKHLIDSLIRTSEGARIFALTYSPDFFRKQGFVIVPKESLPEKIWKDCDHCVNRDDCHETALVYKEQERQ